MAETEISNNSEEITQPERISVATTTFYPRYYTGPIQERDQVDKIRGDLALNFAKEASNKGFQLTVVDGGSSQEFIDSLDSFGINAESEQISGMSASRRQAIRGASQKPGSKVICWSEPEKISLAADCIVLASEPILKDSTDMVIPKRDLTALSSYPIYQIEYEQKANKLWNSILRSHGLLPAGCEDLDVWFGPRFIKNNPDLLKLFMNRYEFTGQGGKLREIQKPELWPNAIFLPVVAALRKKYRVVSQIVPYHHPLVQTQIEQDSPQFLRKRQVQLRNIITTTINYIKLLENDPKSKLVLSPD